LKVNYIEIIVFIERERERERERESKHALDYLGFIS
jgi:hypothetical protein